MRISELQKNRKARGGHRAQAKKLLSKFDELSTNEAVEDVEFENLKIELTEKMATLKALDEAILDEMVSSEDITEGAVEKKVDESGDFRSVLQKAILMTTGILTKRSGVSPKSVQPGTSPEGKEKATAVRVRLPKLNIKKFSGNVTHWQEFWDSFESSIHKNDGLSKVDKFSYLRSLLEEPARSAVAGFSLTAANYDSAVALLRNRFGKTIAVQRAHISELLKAAPVYGERDTQRLRNLCDLIETHYRGLEALEVDELTYSTIVVPALLEKLPETVRLTITRGEAFLEWSVGKLLERLQREVELREEHKLQGAVSKPVSFSQKSTGSALFTRSQNGCAFCRGNHAHEDCRRITDLKERKNLVRRYSRCFRCLRKGHRATDCRDYTKCKRCSSLEHHTAMCDVASKSIQGGSNACSSTEQVRGPATSPNSTGLLVGAGTRIALQTAQAVLKGPKGHSRIRVIFDSGSHKSFITARVVEASGIPKIKLNKMRMHKIKLNKMRMLKMRMYKTRIALAQN